ncbi:unnamed protein product [Effrenium voratum]|nr:unnamed protein product [Effrenium voratum]
MPGYVSHTSARVLRRSCGLFEELGQVKYGDSLLVVAHDLALDKKEAEYAVWANPVPADIKDTMKQARTMEEMRRKQLAPEPGLGPPKEARALGFVESLVVAEAEDGTWGHVRFTGPEGYEVTAITCACAALTLLEEEEALAGNGCGVLTPAVAFHGSGFLERLQALGFGGSGGKLRFEVKDGKPSEEEVLGSLRAASERRQGLEQQMRNVKVTSALTYGHISGTECSMFDKRQCGRASESIDHQLGRHGTSRRCYDKKDRRERLVGRRGTARMADEPCNDREKEHVHEHHSCQRNPHIERHSAPARSAEQQPQPTVPKFRQPLCAENGAPGAPFSSCVREELRRRIWQVLLLTAAGWAFLGGARAGRADRLARRAEGEAPAVQLWTLEVGCTDHYVWKDKDVFVGIVADAGEWTVDLDAVRKGFDEAVEQGSAELFSAPLYVVKAYVKELTSYGLAARAKEAAEDAEEGGYQKRDYKELSPESKEAAREATDEAEAKPMQIVLTKSDHPALAGGKQSMQKFKAYVELATDAAQRWLPPDGELNGCWRQQCLEKAAPRQQVSAVLPSASAPDLRRSRLEKLLSQAKPTPAPSEISRPRAGSS